MFYLQVTTSMPFLIYTEEIRNNITQDYIWNTCITFLQGFESLILHCILLHFFLLNQVYHKSIYLYQYLYAQIGDYPITEA